MNTCVHDCVPVRVCMCACVRVRMCSVGTNKRGLLCSIVSGRIHQKCSRPSWPLRWETRFQGVLHMNRFKTAGDILTAECVDVIRSNSYLAWTFFKQCRDLLWFARWQFASLRQNMTVCEIVGLRRVWYTITAYATGWFFLTLGKFSLHWVFVYPCYSKFVK